MLKIILEPAGAWAVIAEDAHPVSADYTSQLCRGIDPCAHIERQLPAELPVCMLLNDHSPLTVVTSSLLRASLFQHQLSGNSPQEREALLSLPCWTAV